VRRHAIWTVLIALVAAACSSTGDPSPDALSLPADAEVTGESSMDADDVPARPVYTCTQVMGVSVVGEWYGGGFEDAVDDGRWQAITKLHAYIDLWSDPADPVWATEVTSPCVEGSGSPDRVLFLGCNWTYTTAAEWTTAFTAVVEDLRARYSNLRRVELLTMLRAPGNQLCGPASSAETIVQPFIDEAVEAVAAAYPGLVTAAPRFEAPSCDVFLLGGPHFTPAGKAEVAKVYGDYYANEP